MNPVAILVRLASRSLPWALVGGCGAIVGAIAVRGARSADGAADAPGVVDDGDDDLPPGPVRAIRIGPLELVAGAAAGPALAMVLRPRPLGAFLGGLAAGAVAAALIPRPAHVSAGGDHDDWRMPR
jgi:hypothetical protein